MINQLEPFIASLEEFIDELYSAEDLFADSIEHANNLLESLREHL